MANKAGIIPSGNEQDMVARIAMEAAKGNEALARLYVTLLARYHERIASQEYRSSERDKTFSQQERMLDLREQYRDRRNQPDPNRPNPMGSPGAGGDPRTITAPPAAAPAAPAAAPAQNVPPAYRPSPALPGATIPGSRTFAPQGSDSKKFSLSSDAANAYAQAPPGAGDTEFSAQSRVNPTAPGGAATRPRTTLRPPEQLPRAPSRKTQMAEFLPIRREWLDLMTAEEKKHKLPPGSLLVTYGMENGGGKVFGNDPNKAYGLFQWTKQLRDQYKISDADAMNPAVMIPATAANMRRNANEYKRVTGKDLPATNEHMPFWVMLHQWGIGDGPRMVHAALSDAGHMPAAKVMLTNPGGRERNNNAILSHNGVGTNPTIKDVVQNATTRSEPYHSAALRIISSPDEYTADDQAPRPPADVGRGSGSLANVRPGVDVQRVVPAATRAVNAVQALYPSIEITSGYRGPGHRLHRHSSQHSQPGQGTALDISLRGLTTAQKIDTVERLRAAGAKGIGNYGGDMIHVDWRSGGPAAWGPNKSHTSLGRTPVWFQRVATNHLANRPPQIRDDVVATRTAAAPAATAPAAAPTSPPAAAPASQPAPYVTTPVEAAKTPEAANQIASMFGVKPSAPLADAAPGAAFTRFGETIPRPMPRASELARAPAVQGPQQPAAPAIPPTMAAAIGNEYAPQARATSNMPMPPQRPPQLGQPGAPELPQLPPIAAAAEGNEYAPSPAIEETIPSSIQRPPQQPVDPAAVSAEYAAMPAAPPPDWGAPSSIPSIRATGSVDEQIARNARVAQAPAVDWSAPSAMPSVRMGGSPDEQIQRNMDATLPSWEYSDYDSRPPDPTEAPTSPTGVNATSWHDVYSPGARAAREANVARAGQEFPFPEEVPPSTQVQAPTPEDVITAQTAREVSPRRPNAATSENLEAAAQERMRVALEAQRTGREAIEPAPQAPQPPAQPVTPPVVDSTNWMNDPYSRESRQYRSDQRGQFVSNLWDSAKNISPPSLSSIRDAIYNSPVATDKALREANPAGAQNVMEFYERPKYFPDTPELDKIIGPKLEAMRKQRELIGQGLREAPQDIANVASDVASAVGPAARSVYDFGGRLLRALPSPVSKERQEQFARAAAEWAMQRRQQQLDQPKTVRTVNPVAPDPSSTKPNAAPATKPAAAQPKDEPIVLTPRPGAAYVPFQNPAGVTPSTSAPSVPLPRKPGTTGPAANATVVPPAGVKFERVGPGQFIAVPIEADKQPEAEPQ